jgi:pre-mRNA-processing factor 19
VIASLSGHTKRITRVAFREPTTADSPTLIMSASADKTSRVWGLDSASGEFAPRHTIKCHKGEVTGLTLLPTKNLLALSSADKTYSIHDLVAQKELYRSPVTETAFTSAAIHPDGLLLALGASKSIIQIFDIRSGAVAASLSPVESSELPVESLSFSENGYQLCAPSSSSSLSIWDLRHLSSAATIDLGSGFKINSVKYDTGSSLFIGVAGNEGIRVFRHKTWEEIVRLDTDGLSMSDLDWNADATQLWATGGREVRMWGPNST